jgi:hypothetical protein
MPLGVGLLCVTVSGIGHGQSCIAHLLDTGATIRKHAIDGEFITVHSHHLCLTAIHVYCEMLCSGHFKGRTIAHMEGVFQMLSSFFGFPQARTALKFFTKNCSSLLWRIGPWLHPPPRTQKRKPPVKPFSTPKNILRNAKWNIRT